MYYFSFRKFLCLIAILLAVLSPHRRALAQANLPSPPLLPNPNPLCDTHSVGCLDIDDFAGHGYVHVMVMPETASRETAVMFPFGVSLGVFGRFHIAASTSFTYWVEKDEPKRQFGPIRLNFSALLWPLFPLSQAPQIAQADDGASYFQPRTNLRIGAEYEHQLRVSPFDGANSLGLMRDLSMFRVIAVKSFGPLEITASGGSLFEWNTGIATGIAGAEVGLFLPGFKAMKLFTAAQVRGFGTRPSSRSTDASAIVLQVADLIQPQAVVGGGASFRPSERVDFGLEVLRGFGGIADYSVLLRFAVFSVGRTYQGRQATPVVQLGADLAATAVQKIHTYWKRLGIDPILDETCTIRDHDHSVMGTFGKPTLNKHYCEQDGFVVPMFVTFYRPPIVKDKLCYDNKLTYCILEIRNGIWQPVHEPRLNGACELRDSDGSLLGTLGEITDDKKHCRYLGERANGGYAPIKEWNNVPIGVPFYADDRLTKICRDRALKHCMLQSTKPGERLRWEALNHGGQAVVHTGESWFAKKGEQGQAIAHKAEAVATGKASVGSVMSDLADGIAEFCKVSAETAVALAEHAAALAVYPSARRECIERAEARIKSWWQKRPEEQAKDVAETGTNAVLDTGAGMVGGKVLGAAGAAIGGKAGAIVKKGAGEVAEHVDEAAAHRLLKQLQEKEAKDLAEKAAKEAKEKAEQRARWEVEERAKERAEKEAKERAEKQAKDAASETITAEPKGGTYLLRDRDTGRPMRSGRTSDHDKRRYQHGKNRNTEDLDYDRQSDTDDYPEQRGHEQLLHDEHKPPLDKIRPISPKNPKRQEYLDAAKRMLERREKE